MPRHCDEHRIQAALFKWARYSAAETPVLRLMFAIPNGGARDAITGAILKAEGVKPGVPDVFLPVASGPFHGLFIELKSAKGRASPEQREWLTALRERGYATALCHDLGEGGGSPLTLRGLRPLRRLRAATPNTSRNSIRK